MADLIGDRSLADERERTLTGLADRAIATALSPDDQASLETLLREFNASASWQSYQADSLQYFRDRTLAFIAHQLRVATGVTE
jgi:hypothetical protein